MEFTLLGGVHARHGQHTVTVAGAQLRAVLAMFLLEPNQVVPLERLQRAVWDETPPARARNAIQGLIKRLRQWLPDPTARLETAGAGYLLRIDPNRIDLYRFRELTRSGREHATRDDDAAAALFGQALALWRGPALADTGSPWLLESVAPGLDAERLATLHDRIAADLRLNRHRELVAELTRLIGEHPTYEPFVSQLMIAHYRSGDPAHALEVYRRAAHHLAEDTGLDPSPDLRALQQTILRHDPVEHLAPTIPAPTTATPARPVAGFVPQPRPPAAIPPDERAAVSGAPQQLPPAPACFVGRADQLAVVTAALDTAGEAAGVPICVLYGTGGIGKTWLALHWAHQHTDDYPDGQLFVDLQGFAPATAPMPQETALRGFLDALGVDSRQVPPDLDARAGRFRSLVAGRRMLIVLDNARDAAQVERLLPGSPSCAVIVTSRDRLTGLITTRGARPLPVAALDPPESRALLSIRLGRRRLAAEPEAVSDLVACCGGFPLALSIVAGRAQAHQDFPLTSLVGDLRDREALMGVLDDDEPAGSLPAVLSWSVTALAEDHVRLFDLLGSAPGPDIGLEAAAALSGLPLNEAAKALRSLERVSLLDRGSAGRYHLQDLVRLYAAGHAANAVPEHQLQAGLRRLADFYTHTALAGDRLLSPTRPTIPTSAPTPGLLLPTLADKDAANSWFRAEHRCLLATQQLAAKLGWATTAWELTWALNTFHFLGGHLHDDLVACETGLAAADQGTDPSVRALARCLLGNAHARLGRYPEAKDYFTQALAVAEAAGDRSSQAYTHHLISWMYGQQDRDRDALDHATSAMRLFDDLGEEAGLATALNQVGWYLAKLGNYGLARERCERALALHRHHRNPGGIGVTLDSLGFIAHHTSDLTTAQARYREALDQYEGLGHSYYQADTLDRLGRTCLAAGRTAEAHSAWEQALRLYRSQGRVADAERVSRQIADQR
ncbi:AfsR/SARP family transcriptional regulator [Solihabitans fulvus]|uniref:AfsR/SARP family transcriptional regulator n=1 Tax=Solihabitans fulvus TaxID=1892852 RepID=UPI0016620BE0|nr:AfsR/SARP family transcriptional regulator [Solihabitans fulvus]